GEKSKHVCCEVQHHEMGSVLLSHQPTGKEGEAGLHEQHQVSRIESPSEVSGNSEVTDGVGELRCERLLCRLGLIVIEILLELAVVCCSLVGRLGNHKGSTSSINHARFVSGGCTRRIWFGFTVREAGCPQPSQHACEDEPHRTSREQRAA